MAHDWLLVETLGDEPAVVAQGRQVKPRPHHDVLQQSLSSAVRTAIAESPQTGQSHQHHLQARPELTEPVVMSDGRLHGVHV
jgi:ABC-type glutathione transport system ATPase component